MRYTGNIDSNDLTIMMHTPIFNILILSSMMADVMNHKVAMLVRILSQIAMLVRISSQVAMFVRISF